MKRLFMMLLGLFIMNSAACTMQAATPEDEAMSQKNAWAISGTLTPPSNPNISVGLQAHFPDPGQYTVQFAINGPDESATNGARKTVATVAWDNNGNTVTRTIDVVNGTAITGVAAGVDVTVTDQSTGLVVNPYTVSISVAPGGRGTTQQPPFLTGARVQLTGASSFSVPVPQNAGVISAFVTVAPQTIGGLIANEYDVEAQMVQGVLQPVRIWNPRPGYWVPMATGVTSINLVQAGTVGLTTWNVTFGIEG